MTPIDATLRRDRILNVLCALIAIVVLVAFGRLLHADFTNWDDAHTVVENSDFAPPTAKTFVSLWTKPCAHLYVPVTYSVWWMLAKFSYATVDGKIIHNPHVFHVANIAMHAAAACAVFAILRRLNLIRSCAVIGGVDLRAASRTGRTRRMGERLERRTLRPAHRDRAVAIRRLRAIAIDASLRDLLHHVHRRDAEQTDRRDVPADGDWRRRIAACVPVAEIVRGIVPLALFAIPPLIAAAQFQDASAATTILPIQWRPIVALDAVSFYLGKLIWPIHLALDYGRHPQMLKLSGDWRWTILIPIVLVARS